MQQNAIEFLNARMKKKELTFSQGTSSLLPRLDVEADSDFDAPPLVTRSW